MQDITVAIISMDVNTDCERGERRGQSKPPAPVRSFAPHQGLPSSMTRTAVHDGHPVGQRERNIDVVLDHDQGYVAGQGGDPAREACRSLGDRPAHGSSSSNTFGSELSASASSSCRRSP